MEGLLGRDVFVRTSRSLTITGAGDIVLGYTRRLLALNQEMVQLVLQPAMEGALRLGVFQQFGQQFLPALLSEFGREHPKISLTVEVGMTADLLAGLKEDRFDLVVGAAGYTAGPASKMAAFNEDRVFLREPLVWVQSASPAIELKQDPVPLITFAAPCGFRKIALELLEKAGRSWRIVYSSTSLESIQAAVQAGLGISILAKSSVLPGMKIVSSRQGLPVLPDTAIAIYSYKSASESLVHSLSSFIANTIGNWRKKKGKRGNSNIRIHFWENGFPRR